VSFHTLPEGQSTVSDQLFTSRTQRKDLAPTLDVATPETIRQPAGLLLAGLQTGAFTEPEEVVMVSPVEGLT
jgi:hypothetical protein